MKLDDTNGYQGFIQRGDLEFPPPPLPPEIIKLSMVIIVLSQVLNNNLVPDCIRSNLRGSKFNRTPLVGTHGYTVHVCDRAFARYYHPATILFLPPPQLKILYETLILLPSSLFVYSPLSVALLPSLHPCLSPSSLHSFFEFPPPFSPRLSASSSPLHPSVSSLPPSPVCMLPSPSTPSPLPSTPQPSVASLHLSLPPFFLQLTSEIQ